MWTEKGRRNKITNDSKANRRRKTYNRKLRQLLKAGRPEWKEEAKDAGPDDDDDDDRGVMAGSFCKLFSGVSQKAEPKEREREREKGTSAAEYKCHAKYLAQKKNGPKSTVPKLVANRKLSEEKVVLLFSFKSIKSLVRRAASKLKQHQKNLLIR
jgi:hypothetical protein